MHFSKCCLCPPLPPLPDTLSGHPVYHRRGQSVPRRGDSPVHFNNVCDALIVEPLLEAQPDKPPRAVAELANRTLSIDDLQAGFTTQYIAGIRVWSSGLRDSVRRFGLHLWRFWTMLDFNGPGFAFTEVQVVVMRVGNDNNVYSWEFLNLEGQRSIPAPNRLESVPSWPRKCQGPGQDSGQIKSGRQAMLLTATGQCMVGARLETKRRGP